MKKLAKKVSRWRAVRALTDQSGLTLTARTSTESAMIMPRPTATQLMATVTRCGLT